VLSRRWVRYLLSAAAIAALLVAATGVYFYVSFGKMIDARMHGERERSLPRVYARPVELRRGQTMSEQDLVSRLNDLGYAQRATAVKPGEFTIQRNAVALVPRGGKLAGKTVRVEFVTPPASRRASTAAAVPVGIRSVDVAGTGKLGAVELDAPLLTALMTSTAREKRRHMPLASIPKHMQQAVLAIEDQRFYSHPGINPIRFIGAAISNAVGGRRVSGASTITEQLSRMFFFEDEFNAELQTGTRGRTFESILRKARQMWMSIVLERRLSKDEILELYLNDVYLGQRGSFGIHGVAGSVADLLRERCRQRQHQRSGHDCRRDQQPGVALAVRQPEACRRTAEPRHQLDGVGAVHHSRPGGTRHARTAADRGARGRQRGAVLRRSRQPAVERHLPGIDDTAGNDRRLHDTGHQPAKGGAGGCA